jgi:hypothetical protein
LITLEQLGPHGVRERIDAQDREEMTFHAGSSTDITAPLPSALGIGGALTRKTDAAQRLLIDNELHLQLIKNEIWRLYETEEGRQAVSQYARVTRNVLKTVADRLAVAYERPPNRRMGKGGTKAMAQAWREAVLDEGKFDLQAERWARYAFLLNVVHVIPTVVNSRLHYETILPHAADVIFDDGERDPSILVYLSDGPGWCRVAVDNERYWYLDKNYEVVDQFDHGYTLGGKPMKPWTEWRVAPRLDTEDYWQRGHGRQLVDATLAVGVTAARMSYTRKNGSAKQSVLEAPQIDKDIPPGQVLSPEHPLMLRKGVFSVHDLVVGVEDFIAEMDDEWEAVAEAYGVHRGVVDKSKSTDPYADHTAVARVRDQMIPHLRRADLETSIKTAVVMRADGHPLTGKLPPERVKRAISVSFQELSFQSNPKDRWDSYTKELSLGLTDHVALRQREHPEEDAATAEAAVLASIKKRNKFSNLLAQHNLPGDASQDSNNLAQLQGRLGGMARPNPDGNDDDRRDQQQR